MKYTLEIHLSSASCRFFAQLLPPVKLKIEREVKVVDIDRSYYIYGIRTADSFMWLY